MHIALIGASRGIGRSAALELLQEPANSVCLLLRKPSSIEGDPDFESATNQGRVRIIKGDANSPEDLRALLNDKKADKRGMEALLSHVSASLPIEDDKPTDNILSRDTIEELSPGFLTETLIVRPAQLRDTDGSGSLRAGEQITTYSTGRGELGKWIAGVLKSKGGMDESPGNCGVLNSSFDLHFARRNNCL